jgi:hypothetical protein
LAASLMVLNWDKIFFKFNPYLLSQNIKAVTNLQIEDLISSAINDYLNFTYINYSRSTLITLKNCICELKYFENFVMDRNNFKPFNFKYYMVKTFLI